MTDWDREVLERVFVDSPVPIQILDGNGAIRRENDAQAVFDAAFGAEGRLTGTSPPHAAMLRRALGGDMVDYEFTATVGGNGAVEWFYRVLTPVRDAEGSVRSVLALTVDVTDRRRVEEEKQRLQAQLLHTQKLESMGLLAGGIAHDFNNLLVVVLGNASLLLQKLDPSSPLRDYASGIETAARRAADVAHQMLAYSGKAHFSTEPVDLNHLIEETAELLRVSVSRRVSFVQELSREVAVVRADPTQMRQVILNLLTNASEAMGERAGRIVLRTGTAFVDEATVARSIGESPPGQYVFLEVEDQGAGMSEATRARIFDPFFTTKTAGRGLGLAAVFGIVRVHRGLISVTSREGEGTRFRVLLPVPRWASSRPAETAHEALATPAIPEGGVALVVDDEAAVRRVVASLLATLGLEVVEAENGLDALEHYQRSPSRFSVVLLDLTMPVLDGRKTYARLRSAGARMPVVLMSGFEVDVQAERGDGTVVEFLAKPFTLTDVTRVLSAVLGTTKCSAT